MITIETPGDLRRHEGEILGHSGWVEIDQKRVDDFAKITGDDQWIHVDVERAGRDAPQGKTIVHGLLLLSLAISLQREIYTITRRGMGLNYGYDLVRFLSPVSVGARVRLVLSISEVQAHKHGTRIVTEQTIEIDGADKPALVARHVLLIHDE